MGFASWNTADTNESIPSIHAGNAPNAGRTVYMLQPNGKPPIKEEAYEGYGRFGGVFVYDWLKAMNESISSGSYFYCKSEDRYYCCHSEIDGKQLSEYLGYPVETFTNYSSTLDNGKTPNECLKAALWEERDVIAKYPLKFSFDPNAVYEDLPASTECDYQGFFYP